MWGLDTIIPWTPSPPGIQIELIAINALRDENELVALIGSANSGPQGRYGLVGIPSKTTIVDKDGSNLDEALPIDQRLKVIALGYELGRNWVHLDPKPGPAGQPPGFVFEFENAIIVDHWKQLYTLVGKPNATSDKLTDSLLPPHHPLSPPCTQPIRLIPTVSDAEHSRRIELTQDHIAAGDIYQANIARRLEVSGELCGIGAITALSRINPVAHGAYIKWGEFELASNTMETLFSYEPHNRRIASFPIKGTCERVGNESPESPRAKELLATPKERAEHVMIVDLVRNDLGRICEPGSVQVPRLMGLEGYKGVWHGVSTVEGKLRPEMELSDGIRSLFPGGSITGAPKRRSMELIQEIEKEPRGFYTGSIGLITPQGYANVSILIRTLIKDDNGWGVSVGGGIVWDSNSEREITETWEKVSVFQSALRPEKNESKTDRRKNGKIGLSQTRDSTGSNTANELMSKAASKLSRSAAGSTIS